MELNFRIYKEAVKVSSNLEVILVESILDFKRFSASVTHEIESVLVVQLFKLLSNEYRFLRFRFS